MEDIGLMEAADNIPTYRKYTISVEEAARYYGIGENRLRKVISDHPMEDFYLEVGRRILIKRVKVEKFLDNASFV